LFLSKLYVIQAQSVMSALKWVRDSKACLNAVLSLHVSLRI